MANPNGNGNYGRRDHVPPGLGVAPGPAAPATPPAVSSIEESPIAPARPVALEPAQLLGALMAEGLSPSGLSTLVMLAQQLAPEGLADLQTSHEALVVALVDLARQLDTRDFGRVVRVFARLLPHDPPAAVLCAVESEDFHAGARSGARHEAVSAFFLRHPALKLEANEEEDDEDVEGYPLMEGDEEDEDEDEEEEEEEEEDQEDEDAEEDDGDLLADDDPFSAAASSMAALLAIAAPAPEAFALAGSVVMQAARGYRALSSLQHEMLGAREDTSDDLSEKLDAAREVLFAIAGHLSHDANDLRSVHEELLDLPLDVHARAGALLASRAHVEAQLSQQTDDALGEPEALHRTLSVRLAQVAQFLCAALRIRRARGDAASSRMELDPNETVPEGYADEDEDAARAPSRRRHDA
jgi:hypothetical protein